MTAQADVRLVPIDRDGRPAQPVPSLPEPGRAALVQMASHYARAGFVPPWIGYAAVLDGVSVGICAFKEAPRDGQAEISYFTFPGYEGMGIATRMAQRLLAIAAGEGSGVTVTARTLPEKNASNAVLAKLGFRCAGVVQDPEDGPVWEWRLDAAPPRAKVASSREEAAAWTGTAVAIDVIRFSTTLSALIAAGRKTVRIYASGRALKRDLSRFPGADVFSELDLAPEIPPWDGAWEGYRRFDNSPARARDPAGAGRPALVATSSGSKAATACGAARTVIAGCFANFSAAVRSMRGLGDPILLVPAALWLDVPPGTGAWIEDAGCAAAFAEAAAGDARPEEHVRRVLDSERSRQFREYRPQDQGRDLNLCLSVDAFVAVPKIRLEGNVGVVAG